MAPTRLLRSTLALTTAVLLAGPAARAADPAAAWSTPTPELKEVLGYTGDPSRGRESYVACRSCHKGGGAGPADGSSPRLAGQHARVIIKQVTDVRAGIRQNPRMASYASDHMISTQEIADLAAFLSAAQSPKDPGQGPGTAVAKGKALYESKGCTTCHGARGEGDAEKFYPVIAAQHYAYLERELVLIQQGKRGNSHPEMVSALKGLTPEDLQAIADYLSRLPDYRKAAAAPKK